MDTSLNPATLVRIKDRSTYHFVPGILLRHRIASLIPAIPAKQLLTRVKHEISFRDIEHKAGCVYGEFARKDREIVTRGRETKKSIKQENHKRPLSNHFGEVNVTKLITEIRSIRWQTEAVNSRLYSVVSVASIIFPTMPTGPR